MLALIEGVAKSCFLQVSMSFRIAFGVLVCFVFLIYGRFTYYLSVTAFLFVVPNDHMLRAEEY